MNKYILYILALFLPFLGSAQDVKITHNLPASASGGETIDAQYTVTKGTIGAFAKFQCDLPAGYQVAAGDTKSGNFTFENNRVKIVWVSLPSDPTFNFSIKITIPSGASGTQTIAGQFYYLENNVKKEFDLEKHDISIGGSGSTASSGSSSTSSTGVGETGTSGSSGSTSTGTGDNSSSGTSGSSGSAGSTSTGTGDNNSSSGTSGSSGSTGTTSTGTGDNSSSGSSGTASTGSSGTSSTGTGDNSSTGSTSTTGSGSTNSNTGSGNTSSSGSTGSTGTSTGNSSTGSSSKSGVTYYIQLAALSADPGLSYKKFGKVKVVVENGMYKVLVGTYSSLEDARKHKGDYLSKGVTGCFVVGYENGQRVKL